ncbi:MAG: AraC family transcriptional regulator [Lachnospiraceae bacterium]|nr:AraC family transcriptional regulator [Lachnospiraceae bacterium]MDE6817164.1 AraC family transcriptional regulator [Lachnospiraceae bacterium]MDE6977030.1 AraC family transcriptional regulator [Lachnospiraceae bacterium]
MEKAYKLEFAKGKDESLIVNCCGLSRTEPLHSFGPAIKPHYLIHFILSGKGKFSMGGKEYPLEQGYGFLILPEELAFYQADEEDPWTYVWVGFGGSLAPDMVRSMGMSLSNPIFRSEKGEELYQAVKDMMEHNTFGVANDLRRNGQLHLFLSLIAQGASLEEKGESRRADNYVRRAVEFIQGNYCNPIRITDVADYVCINRSYLYTLFHESTGMSPQQFLTTFRITKATELLQLTDLPVESIALSCGYTDPLVFSKSFKQMKKMSPSAYRKEMQKGETRRNKEYLRQIEDFISQVNELNS